MTEQCCICHRELEDIEIYDYTERVFCELHFLEEVIMDCKRIIKNDWETIELCTDVIEIPLRCEDK